VLANFLIYINHLQNSSFLMFLLLKVETEIIVIDD